MPLDLLDTATQVDAMAGHIRDREGDRLDRVERAVDAVQNFEADRYAAAIATEADRGRRTLDLTADPAVTLPAASRSPVLRHQHRRVLPPLRWLPARRPPQHPDAVREGR